MADPAQRMVTRGRLERIMALGRAGTGKTYNWLTMAEWLQGSTFHVIDPDDGVISVWDPDFPKVNNIKYYFTPKWLGELKQTESNCWYGSVVEAFKKISSEVKLGDWIVVEHMGTMWDNVQSGFTDEIFEKNIGLFFLERRKALEKAKRDGSAKKEPPGLQAFDGWKDWVVINKLHNADLVMPLCYELPAHVYMTSSFSVQDPKLVNKEDSDVKGFYDGTLVRIDGQKHLPFKVQTILLFGGNPKEGFAMTTFQKDRGRRWIKNVPVKNFAKQYLIGVGGWSADGKPPVRKRA